MLDSVKLQGADLRGVFLGGAWLQKANMMQGTKLGELVLERKHGVASVAFSPDCQLAFMTFLDSARVANGEGVTDSMLARSRLVVVTLITEGFLNNSNQATQQEIVTAHAWGIPNLLVHSTSPLLRAPAHCVQEHVIPGVYTWPPFPPSALTIGIDVGGAPKLRGDGPRAGVAKPTGVSSHAQALSRNKTRCIWSFIAASGAILLILGILTLGILLTRGISPDRTADITPWEPHMIVADNGYNPGDKLYPIIGAGVGGVYLSFSPATVPSQKLSCAAGFYCPVSSTQLLSCTGQYCPAGSATAFSIDMLLGPPGADMMLCGDGQCDNFSPRWKELGDTRYILREEHGLISFRMIHAKDYIPTVPIFSLRWKDLGDTRYVLREKIYFRMIHAKDYIPTVPINFPLRWKELGDTRYVLREKIYFRMIHAKDYIPAVPINFPPRWKEERFDDFPAVGVNARGMYLSSLCTVRRVTL